MKSSHKFVPLQFAIVAALFCTLSGCGGGPAGPDLGDVTGTVTLDGSPIEGALVTFQPPEGRPSVGTTDASGVYTLKYTADKDGAVLGSHSVSITTERAQSGGEGDQPLVEAREELLPEKYHTKTELTAEVSAGSNTKDFQLTSD